MMGTNYIVGMDCTWVFGPRWEGWRTRYVSKRGSGGKKWTLPGDGEGVQWNFICSAFPVFYFVILVLFFLFPGFAFSDARSRFLGEA
jgi:hypothetical protein